MGAKIRLNRVNNRRKESVKTYFLPRQFCTLYEQQFSNLRSLLFITFPKRFEKYLKKSLHIGLWEVAQKTVNRSEKHQPKKIKFSKAKFPPKKNCAGILHPLLVKVFKLGPIL